mgnify:CR=1 FL=1
MFLLCIVGLGFAFVSLSEQNENSVTTTGTVFYNRKAYPDYRVNIIIKEDGKFYKQLKCDERGRFETELKFNHEYLFLFDMEYHVTSKVLVNTSIPPEKLKEGAGGLFKFETEIFERVEGMNYSLLNQPLMKILYYPEKDEYSYDKKYDEKVVVSLEGFRNQLAVLKQRRRDILKEEKVPTAEELAAKNAPSKPKKSPRIVFEEPKKKKAVNKRGHRNIMDLLNDPKDEDEGSTEELAAEDALTEEQETGVIDTFVDDGFDREEIYAGSINDEDLELVETIDASEEDIIRVKPRVITLEIDTVVIEDTRKGRVQEQLAVKRKEVEKSIREELRVYNSITLREQRKRFYNRKIREDRFRSLIKTVAIAEIFKKKEKYEKNPPISMTIQPEVVTDFKESFAGSIEKTSVIYPGKTITFVKRTTFFFFTTYIMDHLEVDEESYCGALNTHLSSEYSCEV